MARLPQTVLQAREERLPVLGKARQPEGDVKELRQGSRRLRVLVADDEADVRRGLRPLLESLGADVREAADMERALEILDGFAPHVVVSDLTLGDGSGLDLLDHVREHHPGTPVVMTTGSGTIEVAVDAMRRGAAHFFTKPFDPWEILAEIEHQGREALAAERAAGAGGTAAIVAEDRSMLAALELVRQVAPTPMPVLISGESGTGKELIARAIHQHSRDSSLPFLPVNSAALPDTLLESELFGHVKGAFTGADAPRDGVFAKARGGTVFLDEIALMSPAFQGKLLRVLQEHTVIPLGSSVPKPVAFRLVAATNRDLRKLIQEGSFRDDLYYRLRVVTVDVPPLRERPDDIVPLAHHFLARHAREVGFDAARRPRLTADALDALRRHGWPGNVRELENSIQRALVHCRGGDIRAHHLHLHEESLPWGREVAEDFSYEAGKQRALELYRRGALERALLTTGGNVSQAAKLCGLTRAAFQRLSRSLDLDRRKFLGGA